MTGPVKAPQSLVALVTGGSRGVGAAVCVALRERGHVAVAGVRSPTAGGGDAVLLDVTDDAAVDAAVDEVVSRHGRLDVVVNNAGVGVMGPVEAATTADLQRQLDVNVVGPHRVTRAALPHLRAAGAGLVVMISSGAGRIAFPGRGLYSASKWALEGLAETLRMELAPSAVDCCLVQLGPVDTDFSAQAGWDVGDTARAGEYAWLAEIADADRRRRFEAADRPAMAPGTVASAIVDLIETPRRRRPTRTVVHPSPDALRADAAAHAALQRAVLTPRGFAALLPDGDART